MVDARCPGIASLRRHTDVGYDSDDLVPRARRIRRIVLEPRIRDEANLPANGIATLQHPIDESLIHDRDPVFGKDFTRWLKLAGVTSVRLPSRSPNLKAHGSASWDLFVASAWTA